IVGEVIEEFGVSVAFGAQFAPGEGVPVGEGLEPAGAFGEGQGDGLVSLAGKSHEWPGTAVFEEREPFGARERTAAGEAQALQIVNRVVIADRRHSNRPSGTHARARIHAPAARSPRRVRAGRGSGAGAARGNV